MISSITNKKVIYLDQFAVSEMIDKNLTDEWKEIKLLLLKGADVDKLVCPTSSEHLIETVPKGFIDGSIHDKFFNHLSNGLTFKSELLVVTQLISSYIRKNNKTLNTYFHLQTKAVLSDKDNFDNLFAHNTKSKNLMEIDLKGTNQLRKAVGQNRSNHKTKNALYQVSKKIVVSKFSERLDDLLKNKQTTLRGDIIGETQIPNWIDSIIWRLLNVHKFKKKEIELFKNLLNRKGFDVIPTLDIRFSLKALISLYSKNESFGDQIDISRISTGLPISDILFTDKKRKSEIVELKLDQKYSTTILSGKKEDLIWFINYLNKLLSTL
ncbi:MAG: hypothetical protein ABF274_08350 [Nonlabens sp.]|uniref:hypothetical protein n=1 Tax=Nonlabens sp. TaxID=1888209 RepID=UPI00321ADBB9